MLTEDCPVIDDTGVRSMAHLLLISLSSAGPLTMVNVRQPYIYPVVLFTRTIDSMRTLPLSLEARLMTNKHNEK